MSEQDYTAALRSMTAGTTPGPFEVGPAAPRGYQALLDGYKRQQDAEDATLNAFVRARQSNPDEYARMVQKAQAAGLTMEQVEQFPDEAERRAQIDAARRLADEAPALAKWLTAPDHAELSKDDLGPLATTEKLLTQLLRGFRSGGVLGAMAARFGEPLYGFEEKTGQALRSGVNQMGVGSAGLGQEAGEVLSKLTGPLAEWGVLPEDIGGRIGAAYAEQARRYQAKARAEKQDWSELPWLGRAALQGVESMPGSLGAAVAGVVTRNPSLAAAFMAAPVAGQGYHEAREKGRGLAQSMVHGASQGAIEYVTEFIPAVRVLQDLGLKQGFAAALRNALVREIPGEQAATLLQDLNDWATLHPDKPFSDYLKARPNAAAETLVATIVATGGQVAIARMADDSLTGHRRQQDQMLLQALGDTAAASKLRERMPAKFRELVDAITRDGPLENIRIPAQAFATYFQSAGMDPAAVAREIGARNFGAALAADTDMVIPTGEYAAKIAGSEHHAGLMPDIRLRDGDLTAREADAYRQAREAGAAGLDQEARSAAGVANDARARIEQDLRDKLQAVGYSPAVAEAYATATAAPLMRLAQESGMDPAALYQRYGLDVSRPMPEVLTRSGVVDAALVGLIERLHAGDVPSDAQVYGQRLTDFLREAGGVRDPGGDLKSRDPDKGLAPFQRRLLRDDGMELDDALQKAREAGFLAEAREDRPDDIGINDLLEALYRDESEPVYSPRNINQAALDARSALEQVGGYLDSLGIDLSQMTDNAQVMALMRQAGKANEPAPDGMMLAQSVVTTVRDAANFKEAREAAKAFMGKPITNAATGLVAAVSRNNLDKMLSGKAVGKSETPAVHALAVANADHLFDRAILGWSKPDDKGDPNIVAIHRFFAAMGTPAGMRMVKLTVKETAQVNKPNPIYTIEAVELNEKSPAAQWVGEMADADGIDPRTIRSVGDVLNLAQTVEDGNRPLPLHQGEEAARGHITIGENRRLSIALLEKANLSTFLHETGHAWLEIMGDLAESDGASAQLKQDWQTLLQWFGINGARTADFVPLFRQHMPGRIPTPEEIQAITSSAEKDWPIGHSLKKVYAAAPSLKDIPDKALQAIIEGARVADLGKAWKAMSIEERRDHHERFARAHEAYLMEGRAPSAGLRAVFQKFKSWLTLVYRQLAALGVQLTPEVRGVFDRLYASDAEIEAARAETQAAPLFLDAAGAGMTEEEFALYRQAIADGTAQAKDDLERRLLRQQQRETEQWWKEARAKLRAEVEAEVDAQPVYRAFAALSAGRMPDGTPIKLSREHLAARHGEAWLKTLPRGFGYLYAREGGVDADTAAELFGFASGQDLLDAIAGMRPRKDLIEAETDQRMREAYGDLLHDAEAMRQAATAALHNDRRAEVLAMELRALRKKRLSVDPFVRHERAKAKDEKQAARAVLDALPPLSAFRDAAAGMIGQMQARDLRPGDYLRAGQKANREAFAAMARDDHPAAYEAKRRELLNHYLYREALAAKDEMDKLLDYARSFEAKVKRERMGKAGADYLDQIDAILERFEFKRVGLRTMDRRRSLREWAAEREAEGLLVNVSDALLDDARLVNYREASVDTLRAVEEALRNIEHLARLKNKLLRKKASAEWDEVRGELLGALEANARSTGDLGRVNDFGDGPRQKATRFFRKADAELLKVEQLVEWLDGGAIDGPWARYFFDLADDAQSREYDLHAAVTARLAALNQGVSRAWRDSMTERLPIALPGINPANMNRYTLLSIAMNVGNASNLDKLLRGRGWTLPQLDAALAYMREEDWHHVQGVLGAVESLWPEIAALEKRVSGVEPPKIEAREIATPWGTFRGGYFPAVYDRKHSEAGAKQSEAVESVQDFMSTGYGRAHTDKGHAKARLDFAAPILLDLDRVLHGHLAKVIKDVSHREAVIGLNKILHDRDIKSALIDRVGEAQYQVLNGWMQTLVSDRADALDVMPMRWLNTLRTHTAIVTMGWKISTMLAQFAGFGPSVDTVGYGALAKALLDFTAHPSRILTEVFEKSGEMRHRGETIERDIKEQLMRLRGKRGLRVSVQATAFYLTAMADRMVSVPTWLAGYRKALAEGHGEEAAIRAGDRAVRLSQGAGGAKDLAAVQRRNALMKLLTMYYSPFSVLYARLRDVGHNTRGVRDLPRLVARSIALVILPAVLGELLAARGPDDDDDEVMWAARKALLYPSATLPMLRDLVQWQLEPALAEAAGGQVHYAPKYQFSPVVSAITKLGTLPDKTLDAMTGEREWDEVAWDAIEASGYVFGLPTAQPRITGEYLVDLMGGEAQPGSLADALRDLAFRRPR